MQDARPITLHEAVYGSLDVGLINIIWLEGLT